MFNSLRRKPEQPTLEEVQRKIEQTRLRVRVIYEDAPAEEVKLDDLRDKIDALRHRLLAKRAS